MSPEERHRRDDDATAYLLAASGWEGPRDVLRDCLACRRPFWSHADHHRYCEPACRSWAGYWRARGSGVMDRMLANAYDAATLILLRATSPTAVLEEIDHEERTAVPVYPRPGTLRWGLAVCAASDCFEQFAPGVGMGGSRRFCCTTCGHRERYRQREATGLRQRAACIRAVVVARRAAVVA